MHKIAVITGGANGLGLELLKILHEKGYIVCNIDHDFIKIEKLKKIFTYNYHSYCGDVSNEAFVIKTVEDISKIGEINVLINSAGAPAFKSVIDYTASDIDICFKGVKGMILFTTNVIKSKKTLEGKIINIMSSASLRGNKYESVYCAAKWAERGYNESLKVAYSDTNLRIYGIYPGGIDTEFYKNSRDYVDLAKQKTFMNPKELAYIIYDNVFTEKKLIIEDLIINRIKNIK